MQADRFKGLIIVAEGTDIMDLPSMLTTLR